MMRMMSEMRATLAGADLVSEKASRTSKPAPMSTSPTVVSGGHRVESAGGGIFGGRKPALAPCALGWPMKT